MILQLLFKLKIAANRKSPADRRILLVLFLIAGCISQCKQDKSFTQDIPDLKNGKSNTLIGIQITADSMSLERLENGFDSIAIRVWLSYNRKDTLQVFTIKRQNNLWIGYFSQGAYEFSEHHDSIRYVGKIGIAVKPMLDWRIFVDSLIRFNILKLTDYRKITSMNDYPLDGGNSVTFEISTKSLYRIYTYEMPGHFAAKHKEAADVVRILNLIQGQFKIKFLGNF